MHGIMLVHIIHEVHDAGFLCVIFFIEGEIIVSEHIFESSESDVVVYIYTVKRSVTDGSKCGEFPLCMRRTGTEQANQQELFHGLGFKGE